MKYEKITSLLSHYCFNFFFLPMWDNNSFLANDYLNIIAQLDSFLENKLLEYKPIHEFYVSFSYAIHPDEYNWCSPSHLAIPNKKWTYNELKEHLETFNVSKQLNQLYLDILTLMALNKNFRRMEDKCVAYERFILTFKNLDLEFPEYTWSGSFPPKDFSLSYNIESIQQIIFHICIKMKQSESTLFKCPTCKHCYSTNHKNKIFCSDNCRTKKYIKELSSNQTIIYKTLHKLASLHSKRLNADTNAMAISDYDYQNIYKDLKKALLTIDEKLLETDFKSKANKIYESARDKYISTANEQKQRSKL